MYMLGAKIRKEGGRGREERGKKRSKEKRIEWKFNLVNNQIWVLP